MCVLIVEQLVGGGGIRSGSMGALGGDPPGASFDFYLKEAFQRQMHTDEMLYIKIC